MGRVVEHEGAGWCQVSEGSAGSVFEALCSTELFAGLITVEGHCRRES